MKILLRVILFALLIICISVHTASAQETLEPISGSSSEGPTSGSSSEGPTGGSSSEGPTSGSSSEGPTGGSSSEGPTGGSSSEGPTGGSSSEGPTGGSSSEGPTGGSSSEGPTGGSSSEGPTTPSPTTPSPTTPEPTESPTKSPTKPPKSDNQCGTFFCPKELLKVVIKTDKQVKQNRMTVKGRVGNEGEFNRKVMFHNEFDPLQVNNLYACVDTKKLCYQFIIYDKKGNGIDNGYVRIFIDDKKVYGNKFATGKKLKKNFGKCQTRDMSNIFSYTGKGI